MTKIIQLSDLHLLAARPESASTLRQLVTTIQRDHADAALCVITGDLADDGSEDSYALLRDALRVLEVPVLLALGNHDRRAPFARVFPEQEVTTDGFVQQAHVAGEVTAIVLDTLEEKQDEGRLCPRRLEWYADALEAIATRHALVFMHHPPVALGLGVLDAIALRDPGSFWRLTEAAAPVKAVLCGHVHRDSTSVVGGVLVSTCRGASLEFPLTHSGDPRRGQPSPAGFTCIDVAAGRLTIHVERVGRSAALG